MLSRQTSALYLLFVLALVGCGDQNQSAGHPPPLTPQEVAGEQARLQASNAARLVAHREGRKLPSDPGYQPPVPNDPAPADPSFYYAQWAFDPERQALCRHFELNPAVDSAEVGPYYNTMIEVFMHPGQKKAAVLKLGRRIRAYMQAHYAGGVGSSPARYGFMPAVKTLLLTPG